MLRGVSLVRTIAGAFFKKLPFKKQKPKYVMEQTGGVRMWGAPGFHEERSQLSRATIYTAQLGAAYAE